MYTILEAVDRAVTERRRQSIPAEQQSSLSSPVCSCCCSSSVLPSVFRPPIQSLLLWFSFSRVDPLSVPCRTYQKSSERLSPNPSDAHHAAPRRHLRRPRGVSSTLTVSLSYVTRISESSALCELQVCCSLVRRRRRCPPHRWRCNPAVTAGHCRPECSVPQCYRNDPLQALHSSSQQILFL